MTMNKQQAMSKCSTASCSIISTVPFENNSIKTQGKILFSESILLVLVFSLPNNLILKNVMMMTMVMMSMRASGRIRQKEEHQGEMIK